MLGDVQTVHEISKPGAIEMFDHLGWGDHDCGFSIHPDS
jgi:hypothetical protein